jgi:hypothetical protein
MDKFLKEFLASGKQLVKDSKIPRQAQTKRTEKKGIPSPASGSMPDETNPHKIFVSRVINQKMKGKDIVADIQRMCDAEDSKL